MKRFFHGIKGVCCIGLAVLCAGAAVLLLRLPLFEGGRGYELYPTAFSSAVLQSEDPLLDKCRMAVRGESVRYDGDKKDALIARFCAKVLFTEEACGVVNYYCYSPLLRGGVRIYGRLVNLHIALSGEQTAVGSPLILGGF